MATPPIQPISSALPRFSPTFAGQVAVISGALGDIGRAIAFSLAARGVHIALGDVLADSAAAPVLAALAETGVRVRYDRCDVASPESVAAWLAAVQADLGVPTLIVPNAAIVRVCDLRNIDPVAWRREMGVNLDGAFHLAHYGAQTLVQAGQAGRIVFVGSWAGHAPHRPIPTYCVSKAGLRMLMQQMALEYAADGILVNEVAPGYVDAGLSGKLFDANPGSREAAAARVPIHALMSADDVAREVVHLCDPETRHITGAVTLMDGGLSLLRGAGQG